MARVPAARGGAGQPLAAGAASQLPVPLVGAPQLTGLPLPGDPQTHLTAQVAGAAQAGGAVSGPDAGPHLGSWNTARVTGVRPLLR